MKRDKCLLLLCAVVMLGFCAAGWGEETFTATEAGEHALSLTGKGSTYTSITVSKTGDSNEYNDTGSNAAVFANKGAKLTIKGPGSTITTNAMGGHAVFSHGDGTKITISGTIISTQREAGGLIAADGGNIEAQNINVTTQDGPAVILEGGSVNLTDTVLLAGGAESAVWFRGKGAGIFSMTRGRLTLTEDDALFRVEGTAADIALSEVVVNNTERFLFADGGAKVTLKAANQNITGDIEVDGDSALDMTLSGGSAFNGAIPDAGGTVTVTLGSGAKWILTGDSHVSVLANKGTINLNGYKLYVKEEEYGGSMTPAITASDEGSTPPKITTTELKPATVGKSYSATLTATGTKPITWTTDTDALPRGMTFSSSGKLSGKPDEYESYSLEFTAANSAGSDTVTLELNVNDQKPKIKGSMKAGAVDEAYMAEFSLSAGTGDIDWSIEGDLPEGLEFESDGMTAKISGTPAEIWNGSVKISAANETGGTDTQTYTLKVKAVKPKINTESLGAIMTGEELSALLDISGSKPLTVTVTGAPNGIVYDSDSGSLTGTASVAGTYNVKITAQNDAGKTSKTLKLTVNSAPVIGNITLEDGAAGKSYSKNFTAAGTTPITWTVEDEDSLPEGITLSSKGQFKGTPKGSGTYTFTVTATNTYGSDTKDVTMTVKPMPPAITSKSLRKGTAGRAYSFTLATRGANPMTWSIKGELPDGIDFEDGVFSGTSERAFNGEVTVTAENIAGSTSRTYRLTIGAVAPNIKTKRLPSGRYGQDYSVTLKASGTPDIVWSWEKREAPAGLDLDSETGEISGTPIAPGTYNVKISAANDAKTVSKTFKIVIAAAATTSSKRIVWGKPGQYGTGLEAVSGLTLPDGYEVVYELGTVSVDVSGMYDMKLKLDSVKAGAKLFWLARPQNAEPSDDDTIAEFFDEDGEETDSLPANKRVTVSAWLNEGVKYSPTIAVKK